MRVFAVIVLAVMGFAGQGQVCSAQGTPSDGTRPAPAVGRIGTLSPDEARRAARARKRAESAGKVAPTPTAAPAPAAQAAAAPSKPKEPAPRMPDATPRAKNRRLAHEPRATPARPRVTDRRRPESSPDNRRAHLRMHAPPSRRIYADRPRWVPQVGDVVPRGVPLYRTPPYQPYYPDGPIYVPAGPPTAYQPDYPPYPGTPEGY